MSRLDRHVALVQNKLALSRFLYGLAWALLIYAGLVWVAVVVDRVMHVRPARAEIWFWAGVGVSVLAAVVYALVKRPTAEAAAVAIDDKLALKEKFSTALYVRPLKDPFAQAAVKDAERTADNVSLNKRFPVEWPRAAIGTLAMFLAVWLTFWQLPSMDLLGREQAIAKAKQEQQKTEDVKKVVQQALARVNATPKGAADDEVIKRAKSDLANLLNNPVHDPDQVRRSAAKALQDVGEAIKQQMSSSQRFADAQSDAKAFKNLLPADDEKGPVADAQRAIAKGELDKAVDELSKATDKFDKMTEEEQKKAADQMKKMAQQLQQMAQDPNVQKKVEQQLQQQIPGMTQQQAQQMAQQMQQAAQGDKKAQQQLQQQAQQMMKQMNNGQGPNQQQQQQMQQMMKQMQAQANTQQQAQQMAQAAQQMAQAMQQQAKNGQQGKSAQGQQQSQQMAQGKQAMQQQLQAMQAMKADAQQVAAAQQAAQQAAQDAANAPNGGQGGKGQQANGQQKWGGNNGQWQQGQNNQGNPKPNQGMGGAGIGAGPRDQKEEAPYAVKQEIDSSKDIEEGKILASTLVKAKSEKGKSTVGLQQVAQKAEKESTDEVEQERISRQAQQAVKEYFRSVADDADQAPAPAPAPAQQPAQ